MQLKRETDYALRLLLTLKEKRASSKAILTTRELCIETGIPFRITSRILKTLKENGIVGDEITREKKIGYYLTDNSEKINLYDIISLIEEKAELFAAFDKTHSAYRACGEKLQLAEDDIKQRLVDVSLFDLS